MLRQSFFVGWRGVNHRYYEMSFAGALGSGEALLMLAHGMITGLKAQHARATGVYDMDGDSLDIRLALSLPANGGTYGNGRTPAADWPVVIRTCLPVEAMDSELTVETSTGPLRVMFHRVWDPNID
jgi:hypothetical protein